MLQQIRLDDGRCALVRPVRPSDIGQLRQAILTADPETLRLRFLGGRPPKSDEELRRLADLDHVRGEALVALGADGVLVGFAQYADYGNRTADVAIAVHPDWRHQGLATSLVKLLAGMAYRNGIRTVHADYYATNDAVRDLLQELGSVASHHVEFGVVEEDVTLDPKRLN